MLVDSVIDFLFTFQSDVNTVAFADESGNLLYSGSDDNLCKVAYCYKLFLRDFFFLATLCNFFCINVFD